MARIIAALLCWRRLFSGVSGGSDGLFLRGVVLYLLTVKSCVEA